MESLVLDLGNLQVIECAERFIAVTDMIGDVVRESGRSDDWPWRTVPRVEDIKFAELDAEEVWKVMFDKWSQSF